MSGIHAAAAASTHHLVGLKSSQNRRTHAVDGRTHKIDVMSATFVIVADAAKGRHVHARSIRERGMRPTVANDTC